LSTGTSLPETTSATQPAVGDAGPDLRSWLATLEAADQLRRITASVDWDQEIGAITRANLALGGPALLFENIVGHEHTRCRKFLTSGIGNPRQIRLMLGLTEETSDAAVVRHLREAFKRPARSRRTSSRATTSTSGSFRPPSGMPPTAVATSTRSAAWSPRTK
jgi:3-polyprenyl-4-hydroxybenzoate decarboxylase